MLLSRDDWICSGGSLAADDREDLQSRRCLDRVRQAEIGPSPDDLDAARPFVRRYFYGGTRALQRVLVFMLLPPQTTTHNTTVLCTPHSYIILHEYDDVHALPRILAGHRRPDEAPSHSAVQWSKGTW